jgi:site-specific recombinase XerD/ribosomal protein L40E
MPSKKRIFLSKKNEDDLNKFITHIKATRTKNKNSLDNYKHSIQRALHIANKDYDKLTKDDLDKIFSQINGVTCELIKTKFRVFLRYYKKDKLANSIKIRFSDFNKPIKTDEEILTPEEIKTLVKTPTELRDRAIIELLLASGGARREISKLIMGNITIEPAVITIKINHGKESSTQRKHREIHLVKDNKIPSTIYQKSLISWIETHPFKNQPEKPLFYSKSRNNLDKALHPGTINNIITKTWKESRIKKRITPHILRHTSATYDGAYLNEDQMCLKYGWKKGSNMPYRYCHQNSKHLKEFLLKNAGLTEDIIKEESICPNCQEPNNINADRCKRCNYILSRELLNKEIEEKNNRNKKIDEELNNLTKITHILLKGYVSTHVLIRLQEKQEYLKDSEGNIIREYPKNIEYNKKMKEIRKEFEEDYKKAFDFIIKNEEGIIKDEGLIKFIKSFNSD